MIKPIYFIYWTETLFMSTCMFYDKIFGVFVPANKTDYYTDQKMNSVYHRIILAKD